MGAAISAVAIAGISYLYFSSAYNDYRVSQAAADAAPSAIEAVVRSSKIKQNSRQLASYIASWEDSSTRQLVHYALPKKQILDDIEDIDDEENDVKTVAIVDKVIVIPTVKARKTLVEEQLPTMQTAAIQESKLVGINSIGERQLTQNSEAKKVGKNSYTIQLVASHQVSDIHRFRQNNKLFANTQIRHFTNAKGSWYILTLGEYDSRALALSQTAHLPAPIAKLKPWIRPVAGLTNVG